MAASLVDAFLTSCRTEYGLSYGQAVALVLVWTTLSALYILLLNPLTVPGKGRLLAVLPLLAGNVAAPRLFCRGVDATTVVLIAFNTMWLCSFKAIAWALNRGPLVDSRLTPAQFVVVYSAPLTPKHENNGAEKKGQLAEDAGGAGHMFTAWLGKFTVLACAACTLVFFPNLPGIVRSFTLTWALYGLLCTIMDGPAVLLTGMLGLQLSPHFNKPWLSNSFASWWNKRWDLAAGNTLRMLAFDPIIEGQLIYNPKVSIARTPARQLLGSVASFATSGAVHEAIYWYMTGHSTGGKWMCYFLVQVPLIIVEKIVYGALRKAGVNVPNIIRILITISVACLTGHLFFWPPTAGPVSEQVINNVVASGKQLAAALPSVQQAALGLLQRS